MTQESFKNEMNSKTEAKIKNDGIIKGKKYCKIFINTKKKPWYCNKKLSRNMIVANNRSRADHYNLSA